MKENTNADSSRFKETLMEVTGHLRVKILFLLSQPKAILMVI